MLAVDAAPASDEQQQQRLLGIQTLIVMNEDATPASASSLLREVRVGCREGSLGCSAGVGIRFCKCCGWRMTPRMVNSFRGILVGAGECGDCGVEGEGAAEKGVGAFYSCTFCDGWLPLPD